MYSWEKPVHMGQNADEKKRSILKILKSQQIETFVILRNHYLWFKKNIKETQNREELCLHSFFDILSSFTLIWIRPIYQYVCCVLCELFPPSISVGQVVTLQHHSGCHLASSRVCTYSLLVRPGAPSANPRSPHSPGSSPTRWKKLSQTRKNSKLQAQVLIGGTGTARRSCSRW